jgi:hypothetical protein
VALKEVLAHLGFEVDTGELKQADGAIGKVTKSWAALAGVVASAAGAFQIVAFATEAAAAGAELDSTARAAGTSARALAQWRDAVSRAGGDVGQLNEGTLAFSKYLTEARKGGEDQRATLRRLGVELKNADGSARDAGAAFEDAVLALGRVDDAARRAAIADELFGGAGASLVKVSLKGADALAEQRQRFDELNPGLEAYVENAAAAQAALKEWDAAQSAVRRTLAAALLPALEALASVATRVSDWFQRTTRGSRVVEVGLVALAVAAAVAGAALLSAFIVPLAIVAGVAAGVALVVAVVDDLISLFTGGKSAIGQAVDALLGVGTAQAAVESVRAAVATLVGWLTEAGAVGSRVWRALGPPAEALAEILGKVADIGVGAVMSALRELHRLGTELAADLGLTWQGVGDGIAAAVEVAVRAVERALELATGALREVSSAVDSIGEWLGGDDEEAAAAGGPPRTRAAWVMDSISAATEVAGAAPSRGAAGPYRAASGATPALPPADVRVQSSTTIRVEGAGDPDAVARRAAEHVRRQQAEELEFAREAIAGRRTPR